MSAELRFLVRKGFLALLGVGTMLLLTAPVIAQQIISDSKVGKTLGEVKCGNRTMNNAVNYLNNMGVPQDKLINIDRYPEVMRGYRSYVRWKDC